MNINQLLIGTVGITFAGYGALFIVAPSQLSLLVTDASPTTAVALTDMRATYGGMSLAAGVLLFMLAAKPHTERLGLVAVLLLMLGMAGGRGVGMVLDGSATVVMWVYLALELAAAAVTSFLLWHGLSNRAL